MPATVTASSSVPVTGQVTDPELSVAQERIVEHPLVDVEAVSSSQPDASHLFGVEEHEAQVIDVGYAEEVVGDEDTNMVIDDPSPEVSVCSTCKLVIAQLLFFIVCIFQLCKKYLMFIICCRAFKRSRCRCRRLTLKC